MKKPKQIEELAEHGTIGLLLDVLRAMGEKELEGQILGTFALFCAGDGGRMSYTEAFHTWLGLPVGWDEKNNCLAIPVSLPEEE